MILEFWKFQPKMRAFVICTLFIVAVLAGVKAQINIDIGDPQFDAKKAAASMVDQINKLASDPEALARQQAQREAEEEADETTDAAEDETTTNVEQTTEDGKYKTEGGVLILTMDNFDDAIKEHPVILVEFYAPWCGHCKTIAPKYEKAAEQLKTADPPVALAKVDATVETALAEKYEVQGYPTFKFFKNGEKQDYDGPRETEGIVAFMKEKADPNWKPPPSEVVVLGANNFTAFIQNELSLVEFYAPWCGHCKNLAPTYEKAARQLKEHKPSIPIAKVDATVEKDLAQLYEVTGYPTLKVFRKGRPSEYKGTHKDEYDIFDYMVQQVGEGTKEVKTLRELRQKFPNEDVSVVGFFETEKDAQFEAYKDAANELRNVYTFSHTFSASLRDRYMVNPGSIAVFNAERFYTEHEDKWHVLDKMDIKVDDVTAFIDEHKVPLVGEFNSASSDSRFTKRPLCLIFYVVDFSYDYQKATQLWRHKVAKIAKDFRDVTFAIADETGMQTKMKDFELDESAEDLNVGCVDADDNKYRMEPMEEFDSDEIREFVTSIINGKASPLVKSQPIPKRQGLVTVVVGKTFREIVEDSGKDVLIEFYAPWCGHCKQLEPVYNKLAASVKSEKNLVIAKIDSTANDAPKNYAVSGFPTIYFVPANDKANPIKFDGGRTLEDMLKFIKEKATVSFKAARDEL